MTLSWLRPSHETHEIHKSYCASIILVIGPLLVLLLPSIPFQNGRQCDPWYIFGLFYTLPDAMHWYTGYRQIARLPAVIPGFVATHLFDGVLADYALFTLYYLVSLIFLYKAMRWLFSRPIALLGTIFYAAHPLILGNYSITYTAPAVVYNIVCLYFIARAITAESLQQKQFMILASGIAVGTAIHAHLAIASFAFANYVIYAAYEYFSRKHSIFGWLRRMLLSGISTFVGLMIVTVVLGAINAITFHVSFFTIFNQLAAIPFETINVATNYWRPDWYLSGPKVGLFMLGALVATLNLVRTRINHHVLGEGNDLQHRLAAISFGILVLVGAQILYNQLGGVFMQYDHYYVFFVPYLALILFSTLTFEEGRVRYPIITLFLVGSLIAASIRNDVFPWLYLPRTEAYASAIMTIIVASAYAIVSFSKRTASPLLWTTLYLATLVAMTAIVRPEQMGRGIWQRQERLADRNAYARTREGLKLIGRLGLATPPKFWINEDEGYGELIAYPRSYLACAVSQFPQLDASLPRQRFLPGDNVIVVAHLDDLASKARKAFATLGLAVEQTTQSVIDFHGRRYEMVVEHVTGDTEVPHTPQQPVSRAPSGDAEVVPGVFAVGRGLGLPDGKALQLPLNLTTPNEPWSYATLFPIKKIDLRGPFWVQIEAKVIKGKVGIGILNTDGSDFEDRTSLDASAQTAKITLLVKNRVRSEGLVVQSWSTDYPAKVEIKSITVLKPRS
jgi:hypothetical protein